MNTITRIILSLIIIVAVGASAFAASRALLSDQAVLSANTFSTGTVDLKVSTSQSTAPTSFFDQTAGFNDSILPGQTQTKLFWLKNNSTDMDLAIEAQSASVSGEINPSDVTIAFTPMDPTGTTSAGSTISHTLDSWSTPASLENTIAHGAKQRYKMEITLSSDVSTTGSIIFDFNFTGTQTP